MTGEAKRHKVTGHLLNATDDVYESVLRTPDLENLDEAQKKMLKDLQDL